jgi:hypothetical protein
MAPATMASFGIVIESPDGRGCASGAPAVGSVKGDVPPLCNWYTLRWMADDPRAVDWLRAGTPGFPATYVANLNFELGPFDPALGGARFHFEAPAPSPFSMDEVARERPGEIGVRGGYWADTPEGTVKLAISSDDLTSGDATGVVHAAPGSELATLFGAGQRPYVAGYSLIAAERWAHLTYVKQLVGPPGRGERLDSFAGSCSFQGSNAFSPPVTNMQQTLSLIYDATGICSGTLNGRTVSNTPVELLDTGTSDGSCLRARTLAPGEGVVTFPDGSTIRYAFTFTFVLSDGDVTFYGERSGSAHGHGTFLTQRTPPDAVPKCGGDGNSELPLDLTLTTDSPLVSVRQATERAADGGSAALRLAVRPSSTRVGRRTTFTFRVVTADGRTAPGAMVRFVGKRALAGRTGAARIITRLRRPGRWTARATKRGFQAARLMVRARGSR